MPGRVTTVTASFGIDEGLGPPAWRSGFGAFAVEAFVCPDARHGISGARIAAVARVNVAILPIPLMAFVLSQKTPNMFWGSLHCRRGRIPSIRSSHPFLLR